MLSLIKIQKLCNLRENHLSLMEMISDKNNNLDKLYYNVFLCMSLTAVINELLLKIKEEKLIPLKDWGINCF